MAALGRRAVSLLRSVRSVRGEGSAYATPICRPLSVSAKAAAEDGDDVVKAAFVNQQKKFRAYLDELSKAKFELDSSNEAAVKNYSDTMAKIRGSVGVSSVTQKIADLLDAAAEEAPDVRSYLETQRSLRREVGIEDDLGADQMMLSALDKVEKNIGKRLTKDDANGMSLWKKEIDQIDQKLGISDDQLEKMEEEAEYDLAKAELEELRHFATERIDNYKRRHELNIEVDPKELNFRTYL